jgi:tetratricopeptide (TPR) repeat protein
VDWTWYVPGDACVALLCAGWLAGRGERQEEPAPDTPGAGVRFTLPRLGPVRTDARALVIAGAAPLAALLVAWAQWQPQRSVDASQRALAQLAREPRAAQASARAAISRDPLSAQALFTLAAVQQGAGDPSAARATLQRAVRLQPSNPQTWLALGEFDLAHAGSEGGAPAAQRELAAAIYLNPELIAPEEIASGNQEAITAQNDYVEALRATAPASAAAPAPAVATAPAVGRAPAVAPRPPPRAAPVRGRLARAAREARRAARRARRRARGAVSGG